MKCRGLWLVVGLALTMVVALAGCGEEGTGSPRNRTPIIDSLTIKPDTVYSFTSSTLTCWAHDPDGDDLFYIWSAFTGIITGSGSTIAWVAPRATGTHSVFVTVEDDRGSNVADTARIEVLKPPDSLACAEMLNDTEGGGN
jgi:hypothetical protein